MLEHAPQSGALGVIEQTFLCATRFQTSAIVSTHESLQVPEVHGHLLVRRIAPALRAGRRIRLALLPHVSERYGPCRALISLKTAS